MTIPRRALRKAADTLHKHGIWTLLADGNWLVEWQGKPLTSLTTLPHFQRETRHPLTSIPEARLRFQSSLDEEPAQSAGTLGAAILSLLAQQHAAQQNLADELINQYRENALLLKAAASLTASAKQEDIASGLLKCAPAFTAGVVLQKTAVIASENATLSLPERQALVELAQRGENALYDTPPPPWQAWGSMLIQNLPPSADTVVLWRDQSQPSFTSVDTNIMALLAHIAGPLLSHADQRDAAERLHSTLNRYLPAGVAEKLLRENRVNLGGDEYHAAVLFADIRHFTQMTRTLGARMVVDTLNQLYTELVTIIRAHGGIVDKFMGDGIMAIFGVPLPQPAPEQQAVTAADAILNASRALGIDISIGISAGMVIAGNIGSPERMDYTVIGDAVNIAAKLQKLAPAPAPSLLITEACYTRLPTPALFRELATLSILDNTPPVKIYAPTA